MLSIDESSVYYLIKRDRIPTFKVETWTRIRKKAFDKWYASQNKHRTQEDREKDAQMEAETLTMPEMARELYITRKDVYNILAKKENQDIFEIVVIADKKRITRESFERWYAGQSKYRKLSDRTPEELYEIRMAEKKKETPRLEVDPDKPSYNVRETAVLMDITPDEVRQLIRDETSGRSLYIYINCSKKRLITNDDFHWFWMISDDLRWFRKQKEIL